MDTVVNCVQSWRILAISPHLHNVDRLFFFDVLERQFWWIGLVILPLVMEKTMHPAAFGSLVGWRAYHLVMGSAIEIWILKTKMGDDYICHELVCEMPGIHLVYALSLSCYHVCVRILSARAVKWPSGHLLSATWIMGTTGVVDS